MDAEASMGCFLVMLILVMGIFIGAILEYNFSPDEKNGYIQAIIDVENKVPLKYVRREQSNKEVIWVVNTEYKKEK